MFKMISNACRKVAGYVVAKVVEVKAKAIAAKTAVASALVVASAQVLAQVPTAVPAAVQTNLDNASTLVLNIGIGLVVVIAAITAIRYARGVFN